MHMVTAVSFTNAIDAAAFVFEQSQKLGRKFEPTDVNGELELAARLLALTWQNNSKHWADNFMSEMKLKAASKNGLSVGQVKGVLNVVRADQNKALESIQQPQADTLNIAKVKTARFRVVQDNDESVSVRLSVPTWTDAPKGTRKISAMVSGSWIAVGKVDPDGSVRIWKKTGQALTERVTKALTTLANADDDLVYILAYAMLGGKCGFCEKELDTQESLSVGYGPKCAKVNDLPWGDKAVPAKVLLAKAGLVKPADLPVVTGSGIVVRRVA